MAGGPAGKTTARDDAIVQMRAAFAGVRRPDLFIRGTCRCCECEEHERTLAAHTPDTIGMEALGNPGWDPMCFASDQAFFYYLPALIRLALKEPYYWEQLLFHLGHRPLEVLDPQHARALCHALWVLLDVRGHELAGTSGEQELEAVLARLDAPDARDALLRCFHRDHAGATTRAFARGRIEAGGGSPGGSSYDALAREVPANATVLDLGCGDGHLLALLRARGLAAAALTGVDMSPEELALARGRPELAGVSLVETRAQELPLRSGAFSCVVSHLAFTLMSDVDQVVAEIARVLAPGGVFVTMVGGGPKVGDAFELFLDELRPIHQRYAHVRMPRLGDPRARQPDGLRALFCAATGFAAGPEIRDIAVRLDGSVDEVWDSLATAYELYLVSEADRAALRERFRRRALALAASDGRVPCGVAMSLVRCRRT